MRSLAALVAGAAGFGLLAHFFFGYSPPIEPLWAFRAVLWGGAIGGVLVMLFYREGPSAPARERARDEAAPVSPEGSYVDIPDPPKPFEGSTYRPPMSRDEFELPVPPKAGASPTLAGQRSAGPASAPSKPRLASGSNVTPQAALRALWPWQKEPELKRELIPEEMRSSQPPTSRRAYPPQRAGDGGDKGSDLPPPVQEFIEEELDEGSTDSFHHEEFRDWEKVKRAQWGRGKDE